MESERDARAAFGRLYDEHFPAIFRYVLIRVGEVAEAQDLTSQTFFKALRGFRRLRRSGAPAGAWLYRIATNEVNSHYRRRRRSSRWLGDVAGDAREAVVAERSTAERLLQRDEVFQHLSQALRTLATDEQALVVLRYFEHKPFAEIARILRRREGALAMRTHRALRKLRAELERRGVDHEGVRETFAGSEDPRCAGRGVPAGSPS